MPAIVPLIMVGGSLIAAKVASHGQEEAAKTQAGAAEKGTAAQEKAAADALQFQKEQYRNTQIATAPYQNMGAGALAALGSGLGVTPGNIAPTPISLGPQGLLNGATNVTRNPDGSISGGLSPEARQDLATQQPTGFDLTPEQRAIDARNQASSTQNLSQSSVAAKPGETRTINGQQARWDGTGWEAV